MNKECKGGVKRGLLAVIVISFLSALGLFSFLLLIENIVIGEKYRNHDYIMEMTEREVQEFQDFVSKNSINTYDVEKIDDWTTNRRNVFLVIYDGNGVIYDSSWGREASVKDGDREYVPFGYRPQYTIKFFDKTASIDLIFFSNMRARFLYTNFQFALCFMLMLIIILVSFIRLTNYYSKLENDVRIIMAGDVNHKISTESGGGLGALANIMEEMRTSIVERHEKENSLIESGHKLVMTMSHDLRTPLTILIGYLEILSGKKYKDEKSRDIYIGKSLEKAYQIKHLSDKIFEYFLTFNMEEDVLHKEVYNKGVFSELVEDYIFTLQEKDYKLNYSRDTGGNYYIVMDIQYIRRVFDNIFSNITKYADREKTIDITVFNNSKRLVFTFKNRINQNLAEVESTNIGLMVCDKIISNHGGEFIAEKTDGIFTVTIKLPISRQRPPETGLKYKNC